MHAHVFHIGKITDFQRWLFIMIKEEFKDNKRYVSEYGENGDIISEQIFYEGSDRVDCTVFPKGIEFKAEGNLFRAIFDIDDYELSGTYNLNGIELPVYTRKNG
mgnify:CR=1 FL=1